MVVVTSSGCEPNNTMEKQRGDSDNDEVEDIDDDMARYMANPNRARGGTNDTSLREYEDYDDF